ncbi:hypothetical protein [Salmonella phage SD-1_S14]|nr:hypothetical protein [Salmonella phage SD-1_S14]
MVQIIKEYYIKIKIFSISTRWVLFYYVYKYIN